MYVYMHACMYVCSDQLPTVRVSNSNILDNSFNSQVLGDPERAASVSAGCLRMTTEARGLKLCKS